MRFMVMVKATKESEAGVMPSRELLEEMGRYNEELSKAGVLLAGEGLHPSSKGVRVRFNGKERTVIDGPFTETKELVAGFWIMQVRSKEEVIEWVRRCPGPMLGEEAEIEIRPVFEASDFGAEFMTGAPAARGPAARGVGLCCRQVMVFVATLNADRSREIPRALHARLHNSVRIL